MKARTGFSSFFLLGSLLGCDNGAPAKLPDGQTLIRIERKMLGGFDLSLSFSAQHISMDSVASSFTLICPCFFGDGDLANDLVGPILVLDSGTIVLKTIPDADYQITLSEKTIQTNQP